MTYAGNRQILDCDAHIMEPPGWLESFAPAAIADRLAPLDLGLSEMAEKLDKSVALREKRASDPAEAAAADAEFMTMPRKGWGALGDGDAAERSHVLDLLGFDLQLVFPTGSFNQVQASDPDVFVAAAEAMNRGMGAFCADDHRLLGVGYVPFHHGPDAAVDLVVAADRDGCDAVMVDTVPPDDGISHTHPDFDPVWAAITERDLPVMLHVGLDNGWRPVRSSFFANDRPMPHFRSDAPGDALSFLAIGQPAEMFLGSMIFDGVLDRHPELRIGVAELGATWVPSFLHFLDTAVRSFRRMQDLSHLQADASDYIRERCCFSPFAGEDVGWMIETAGADLFMFSSDYPHHEGTDDPIRRFEASMPATSEQDKAAFYHDNFARLLGSRGAQ